MVRTERAHHLDVARAAYAGDLRAQRLRDLHRECADASRCAVDQNLVSRLKLAFVAQALQRRDPRDCDTARLFEADVRRLQHDGAISERA